MTPRLLRRDGWRDVQTSVAELFENRICLGLRRTRELNSFTSVISLSRQAVYSLIARTCAPRLNIAFPESSRLCRAPSLLKDSKFLNGIG